VKITQLNTYTEGGAAEAALRIHNALLQSNQNSRFLSLYKAQSPEKSVYDFRDKLNLYEYWHTKVQNKIFGRNAAKISDRQGELFSNIHSVWNASEHSLVKDADILHLHWISGFVDIPDFVKKHNTKIVWTLHDRFLFDAGFHYPPPVNNNSSVEKIIQSQKIELKKLFSDFPIEIVSPSQYIIQQASQSGLLDKCNFTHIPNPIDPTTFFPTDKKAAKRYYGIGEEEKTILFISDRIHYHRKGIHLLEKALKQLPDKITVLVAGRGKVATEIGKAKIVNAGNIRNKQMLNQLYNAADLLIHPALHDNAPNTISEAMHCGIPVLAFSVGGIPEMINENSGMIIQEQSPEALAKAIPEALDRSFSPEKMSIEAQIRYAPKTIAESYMSVYKRLKV
jgi:glycosyltransferase involved in cell wall biosynthesis